jgi:ATP-dependent Clp protease protease subunit
MSDLYIPKTQGVIPYVTETTNRGERTYDVYSRLLKDRIIFLGTPIDDQVANVIVAQLIFLAGEDPTKEISIYINSPGGEVYSGLAIYDTMQYIKCDIATFCVGMAASMASIILMAGTKGKRFALPHSRVLIHQGSTGFRGAIPDVEIQARETMRLIGTLLEINSLHTGQSLDRIRKDTERDYYMSSDEAKEYGIIDEVVQPLALTTAGR